MKEEYDFSNGVRGKYAGKLTGKIERTGEIKREGMVPKELSNVRRFPEMDERVETGPIMFGDDWPGIFIRGDDAHGYAVSLRELLLDRPDVGFITRRVLEGLLSDLDSSSCANNDAFPAWHKDE